MTTSFDRAFVLLHSIEGEYSDHKEDPGGKTNYGITEAVARAHGYTGDMDKIPISFAKMIYKSNYWLKEFDQMPFSVSYCIFDAGVNHGVKQAVLLAQKVVRAREDGILGPNTQAMIATMLPDRFIREFCAERLNYYTGLRTWGTFGKGWSRRVAIILSL